MDLSWDIQNYKPANFIQKSKWAILAELNNTPIQFSTVLYKGTPHYRIQETFEDEVVFELYRSRINSQRVTVTDKYGLLGSSLWQPDNKSVILTEGVSDYFTTKLLYPNANVAGLTTLTGSVIAKTILISLFDYFVIISDNDYQAERNTGLLNSQKLRAFLQSYNKSVRVLIPPVPFKDITDAFMNQIP